MCITIAQYKVDLRQNSVMRLFFKYLEENKEIISSEKVEYLFTTANGEIMWQLINCWSYCTMDFLKQKYDKVK